MHTEVNSCAEAITKSLSLNNLICYFSGITKQLGCCELHYALPRRSVGTRYKRSASTNSNLLRQSSQILSSLNSTTRIPRSHAPAWECIRKLTPAQRLLQNHRVLTISFATLAVLPNSLGYCELPYALPRRSVGTR